MTLAYGYICIGMYIQCKTIVSYAIVIRYQIGDITEMYHRHHIGN